MSIQQDDEVLFEGHSIKVGDLPHILSRFDEVEFVGEYATKESKNVS
jgi:hypothetical protein